MQSIVYDSGGSGQPVRLLFALFCLAPLAISQRVVNARAGMVYYAEGVITVDGQTVRMIRNRPPQIQNGQTVATPRGHAEILMGPDTVLWTGTGAQLRFEDTSVADAHVNLIAGSLMIEIKRTAPGNRLRVQTGDGLAEIRQAGVYRFDRMPDRTRTFSGEAAWLEPNLRVVRGQELADGSLRTFDRRDTDEFFYWAALRSLTLERDAGHEQRWKRKGLSEMAHAGFDVTFPFDLAAARVKYLAASASGLLYAVDDQAGSGISAKLPLLIGQDNSINTGSGKAELFLGVGLVASLAENSTLRIVDSRAWAPMVALEEGTAIVEVAESKESLPLRVQVGGTTTHLLSPGVYEIDAQSGILSIYRGESETVFAGMAIRAREGQRMSLKEPAPSSIFDRKEHDALFQWAADESYQLSNSSASFMTSWENDFIELKSKHKVYGQRDNFRIRQRPRPRPPSF
jgi:hypothetical protein